MILEDKATVPYLKAFKEGRIKRGVGIGCLLDDLLPLSHHAKKTHCYVQLVDIKNNCMQETTFNRPTFIAIVEQLKSIE